MTTRRLYHLIDELPDRELDRSERLLEGLRRSRGEMVPRILLEAPEDDEDESDEERTAVAEAYEDLARGDVLSHEDVRSERGW